MRRRHPLRLILCLPLLAVMALWAFSYGRYNSWEFFLGQTRSRLASFDGVLRLAVGDHVVTVPYWAVWVAVALVILFVHTRLRRAAPLGRK